MQVRLRFDCSAWGGHGCGWEVLVFVGWVFLLVCFFLRNLIVNVLFGPFITYDIFTKCWYNPFVLSGWRLAPMVVMLLSF